MFGCMWQGRATLRRTQPVPYFEPHRIPCTEQPQHISSYCGGGRTSAPRLVATRAS
jgi:hypothetical protein